MMDLQTRLHQLWNHHDSDKAAVRQISHLIATMMKRMKMTWRRERHDEVAVAVAYGS